MSSSTTPDRTKHEMVSKCNARKIMPADLFMAATQGKRDFFVRHLGLPSEEQNYTEVTVDPNIDQTQEENKIIQYNLDCATFRGETILHILVDNIRNKLAEEVFQKNTSLLKAQNIQLQTPLHYAAKVGNVEIIRSLTQLAPAVVEDALKETDDNMDTVLHLAAKHGHKNVVEELMKLNREMVYKVNKEMLSPLHVAIVEDQTLVVKSMLQVDNFLACTQFADGMFPIHVAASRGNIELVMHLLKNTNYAELHDLHGRNVFHIAAEKNKFWLFREVFKRKDEMHVRMLKAKDNDGNTPLHIAALKGWGFPSIIKQLLSYDSPKELNNMGLTPFELSLIQENDTIIKNQWERSQLIGLGAVLIATVAFAAAFTCPGGYYTDSHSDREHGTPVLGKKYMFRAFTIANALAFIQAFLTVYLVLVPLGARNRIRDVDLELAINLFLSAANCMMLSFGTGTYVIFAPVNKYIATLILMSTLVCASPAVKIMGRIFTNLIQSSLRRGLGGGVGVLYIYFVLWYLWPFYCTFVFATLK